VTEINDARLKVLQARAEAAQSRFETQERTLYRADGERVYGAAEHEERLRTLRAERTAELREVQEEARQVGEDARAEIERVENADPLASLSAQELTVANARRDFALDAADSLGAEDLEKRLRSVLAGGDRGEIGAYFAAGSRARGRIIERRRDRAEENARTPAARASVNTFTALDGVLSEMRQVLVGDETAEIEAARALQQEAVSVELQAATLTVRAYAARNYGRRSA
jgi:hypothetical protein